MANCNPPKINQEFIFYIQLEDTANPGNVKVNPTIAADEFKVSIDEGALASITTPTVSPAGSSWVKLIVDAGEMNGNAIKLQGICSTSPKTWSDWGICILTTT